MIAPPDIDGRRLERFVRTLHAFAPHYTPDLDLSDAQGAGPALMSIFAHLAETIAVRLDRAPLKHFVAFLDALGVVPIPARAARVAVTFKLANGLTTAVTVPAGTRVTAPGVDEEIPFETTNDLIAIAGVLDAMYAVDPAKDAIFRPPPGFLEQKPKSLSALVYRVVSFAGAGADRLQLDHATDLQPGGYVRVDCREKYIVRKVDQGNIVTLETRLDHDVPPGVLVTPIRDFEVFNGINIQEHVLYVGHSRVLTVKSEAVIRVTVELQQSAGEPLEVGWQFWTKNEKAVPEEEEHWEDLVLRSDGTNGFTSSGQVVLGKPADLEIKPRAINQRQNVWIRARLRQRLPVGGARLPEISALQISVDAPQAGIAADQGFYNVTPLDVQVDPAVGFFPFGTEPRQFDQFYLASKEAFSKPEAQVTLNVELDLQTLAAPSVVNSAAGPHAYAVGLQRKLYELSLAAGVWRSLGSPADAASKTYVPVEDTVPSAITSAAGDQLYVFVTTEDSRVASETPSKVWLHAHPTGQTNGHWKDIGTPPSQVRFSPAAIRLPRGPVFARVFVVAVDGQLYSRRVSAAADSDGDWVAHGAPSGVTLDSPPSVVITQSGNVLVFATGTDADGNRIVHRLTLRFDETFDWLASLPPTTIPFKAVSRPFAQTFGGFDDAKVFVLGLTGPAEVWTLFECNTEDLETDDLEWKDLGWPSRQDNTTTTSAIHPEAHAPCGFIEDAAAPLNADTEGKHIFVRNVDGRLYERLDDDPVNGPRRWEDRMRPGDPDLRDSPAISVDASRSPVALHLVSATGRNSVVRWTFEVHRGAPQSKVAVRLDPDRASSEDDEYKGEHLEIVTGTGSGQAPKEVIAYDGPLRLARLETPFATLPDSTSKIEIDGEDLGSARPDAPDLLALHAPRAAPRASSVLALRLDDEYSSPASYSPRTGVISLGSPPPGTTAYTLYTIVAETANEFSLVEDTALIPQLSWEYWNGRGWLSLRVTSDTTGNLLTNGSVQFQIPRIIEPTEVAGQENFWIRARLIGGDYGREIFKLDANNVLVSEKTSLRPPKISRLRVVYQVHPELLEACVTFNNGNYLDQTAAARPGAAHFPPFERLEDDTRTLFFGFDAPFKTGPVRLLLDAAEREVDPAAPPAFRWQLRKDHQWRDLAADDGSQALTRQGILTLSAAEELTRDTFFGRSLFWIKASLREGRGASHTSYPEPLLRGVFLNTVWADHGETITEEIVGSSDGEPGQRHALQNQNVLHDEDIRIREALSVEEREQIQGLKGPDSIIDREDIGGPWVRWNEVRAFFDAGPSDRYYSIDRAAGVLRFGDGVHGSIPPAGADTIRAFRYRTGGGAAGNLDPGAINTLTTAVQGIESVFNPTAAGGGADTATTETMLELGPRQISHRDRAVSPEDFEKLAIEASRQVAKARCLSTTNLQRATNQADPCDPRQRHTARRARGWVSVMIVPRSRDPQPCPSLELRRIVLDYLRERAPSLLVAGGRLVVRPPDYIVVSITADVFVASLERAASAEQQGLEALQRLLHPLEGGPEGRGWEFGRPIAASDVFAALEAIPDVDHVENLVFHVAGRADATTGVEIGSNELLAGGKHVLRITRQVR